MSNVEALFGRFDLDEYREAIFALCYHQHGGSGLSFSYAGVQDMPLADFQWYLERLADARSREHTAMKNAQSTGRR